MAKKTNEQNSEAKIIASLQGPEWDSGDEDTEAENSKRETRVEQRKRHKKNKMEALDKDLQFDDINDANGAKNGKVDDDDDDDDKVSRGGGPVLYIGHLPSEFGESQLSTFLKQFGKIGRIRVSQSSKSGKPRGFALVQIPSPAVAKIVADTLSGYLLGGRRLVCNMTTLKKGMFFSSTSVKLRRDLRVKKQAAAQYRNSKNVDKLKFITTRLISRERKKKQQLQKMGIDYTFPGYEQAKIHFCQIQQQQQQQHQQQDSASTNKVSKEFSSNKNKNKSRRNKEKSTITNHNSSKSVSSNEKNKSPTATPSKAKKTSSVTQTVSTPTKPDTHSDQEGNKTDTNDTNKSKKKRTLSVGGSPSKKSKSVNKELLSLASDKHAKSTPTKPTAVPLLEPAKSEVKKKKKKDKRRKSAPQ